MNRRDLLAGGTVAAIAGGSAIATTLGSTPSHAAPIGGRMVSATDFGAAGDGVADDTKALQAALDSVFAGHGGDFLLIPPGVYRVSRTLRVNISQHIYHQTGISAKGARLQSAISDGGSVLELTSEAVARYVLIDGLEIRGSGEDGHGLDIACDGGGGYLYNMALRDLVVEGCGGDGCRMVGNVFESQIINTYCRGNGGNGLTLGHGAKSGVLSAVHVFACVFGDNAANGAALINNAYDVSFNGCYFLLNGAYGLNAGNGCRLLVHCGVENNHASARSFAEGDAGIRLMNSGTLVACTGYSVYNQTHLVRSYVSTRVVMIGCMASGGGQAKGAKLASLKGAKGASVAMIACWGGIDNQDGIELTEMAQNGAGVRFGSSWQSSSLPHLGDYCLWVDGAGRLRMKKGAPASAEDGRVIG